jgi:oxygen-independent coproporphyrinogen-3 oxidase
MFENVEFDPELIRRYEGSGPRYTSYPTAMEFSPAVTEQDYMGWVRSSNAGSKPLSLYVHIPFCAHVCFYCACNKIVTGDRSKARAYLDSLYREMRLQAALVEPGRRVEQLHWGGGTPTFLSDREICELMNVIAENFWLREDDNGEYSIEVDPREVREDTLPILRDIGFNRISIGVQDFNPAVQKAVHRIQTAEQTLAVLNQANELNFRSLNIDLMYGLPLQTVDSFTETLDAVVETGVDRLSVFNYAHLPQRFKPQRRINEQELPGADEKLAILALTIEKLTAAGYQYIGMDHFALQDDELSVAQRNGTLHRTFQGYSTHANTDLLAMGVSSIGFMPGGYAQNTTGLDEYIEDLRNAHIPVKRGIALSDDDRLRREVIQALICNAHMDMKRIEARYEIDFRQYFASELERFGGMQEDGLVSIDDRSIDVTARGRLLIRNICKVFDRYRGQQEEKFSKMI